jgi:hypothetical protein
MISTALERAFQLAESGRCSTVEEIRRVLSNEGYSSAQITGSTLVKQLRELMRAAEEQRSARERPRFRSGGQK